MKLSLNQDALDRHRQLFPNSCVAMGVELALKLMSAIPATDFHLQQLNGDNPRSGACFHGMEIGGIKIIMDYDIPRGPDFPLDNLFVSIRQELDAGNYVNCAWRQDSSRPFHAYVIYGYDGDEFFALSTDYNSPIEYISDMGTKLRNIGGSDIITFRRV